MLQLKRTYLCIDAGFFGRLDADIRYQYSPGRTASDNDAGVPVFFQIESFTADVRGQIIDLEMLEFDNDVLLAELKKVGDL